MVHTDGCTGLHTSCDVCEELGVTELTVCIDEFGGAEQCPKHYIED